MNAAKIHNSPLAPLFRRLKTAGYSISIDQMLDIHAFFLSTSLSAIDVAQLKYLIAPLIAKSPEDQEKIYQVIDDHIAEAAGKKTALQQFHCLQQREPKTFREKHLSLFIALLSILSGFLLAFAISALVSLPQPEFTSTPTPVPSRDTVIIQQPDTFKTSTAASSKLVPAYEITASNKILPVSIEQPTVAFRLAIILGILIGVLLSFFLFSVKTKDYITGENDDDVSMKRRDITFPLAVDFIVDENKLLSENSAIKQAGKNFEKHMPGTTPVLHIERSIGKTIANAGAYTLWYEHTREKRRLLFLVDARFPAGHMKAFFDHLLKKIGGEKLSVERYYYQHGLLELNDTKGKQFSLNEISGREADRQLVILGACENIFDEAHTEETLRLLQRWTSRSIITPLPLEDWGQQESYLLQKKFRVVPADSKAIELLSNAILLNNIPGTKEISGKLEDAYSLTGIDFQNVHQLRHYCGDEAIFQFVCSLAVYPKLSWPLTISLYDALLRNRIPAENQYDLLLKIARISWLNFDTLDDQLRLSLLNELRPKTERATRKKILELLKEMERSVPPASPAGKELEIQKILNQFILFAHNKKAFKEYSDSTKHIARIWDELKEWPLKKHIDSGKGKLFQEHSGRHMNIEDFFAREKEVRRRKITVGRIAVTLIPPLVIYLLMTWSRPGFAYLQGSEQLTYQPSDITLVFTKQACWNAGRVEIDAGGKQYYISMVNETETVQLKQLQHDTPIRVMYYSGGLPRLAELNASHLFFNIRLKGCE